MTTTVGQLVSAAQARVRRVGPVELEAHLLARDAVLVDVREPEELEEHGWIAGAVHVPRGLLEFWADPTSPVHRPELDPRRRTIVYGSTGDRSALAVGSLEALGYRDLAHLDGGIAAWKRAGLPVVGLESWHHITVGRGRAADDHGEGDPR